MSERIGRTAASFTEGLAPRRCVTQTICRGSQSRGIHPSSPDHHKRVQVAGALRSLHPYSVANRWDAHLEMSLSPLAKSTTPLSPRLSACTTGPMQITEPMHRERTYWENRCELYRGSGTQTLCHPNYLPRQSIPRHSPKLPRPSQTCSGSRGAKVIASIQCCKSVGCSLGNEPEPFGEVDYATLPPLVGMYDRPHADIRSRYIVSERIGGTARQSGGSR